MTKVSEYNGYLIDEGFKPHDENFKLDYYQYFFIIKRDNRRIMKYCVWAAREVVEDTSSLRSQGLRRVKQHIDAGEFTDMLLKIGPEGVQELSLDEQTEKIV